MGLDHLLLRQVAVCASGVIYWAGVLVQARRVRGQIGRSPNLRPRGLKETLLWLGWLVVVAGWIGQPVLVGLRQPPLGLQLWPAIPELGLVLGLALLAAGYGGTLWCYAVMGNAWRIGVNRDEKNALVTHGPFRRVRHPIYLFQIVMLAGVACLLPTICSLILLGIHCVCANIKALDEEKYLLSVHGELYGDYLARTGRLLPKLTPPESNR